MSDEFSRHVSGRPGETLEPPTGEDGLVEHLGDEVPARAPDAGGETAPLPPGRLVDRQLSWLDFNERVLDLADDPGVPLLERARFLSIFTSNLDEFFMIRVASLKQRIAAGITDPGPWGAEPRARLEAIADRAHDLVARHARVFSDAVGPAVAAAGIRLVRWSEVSEADREPLHRFFADEVFPVLTPLAVDPAHPFPYISGLSLNLAVSLVNPTTGAHHFARVKVPPTLPRLVRLASTLPGHRGPRDDRAVFVPLEDVIGAHLDQLFPGMDVVAHHTFRVTRNEDLVVDDDEVDNLVQELERQLQRRRFGPAVRLELAEDIDEGVADLLARELDVTPDDVYRVPEPLDLRALADLADLDRPELLYPPFRPRTHPALVDIDVDDDPGAMFAVLREREVLLHHPYDSFVTSVQAFVAAAAADPDVLAIKQTLYRTSADSPIIASLVDAAHAGKQVLAIVEIKARFDEAANIAQSRHLEEAGVHVVYGLVGLKTHAKLSLVVRREAGGVRRYCHVGTGNYHPRTARLYEDFGLLTADAEIGEDLSRLFNQLSGFAPRSSYRRLLVAPRTARAGLMALVDEEIANHRAGRPAGIKLKVNSLVDDLVVDAFYRASQAGVPIDAVVRGPCSLRPGVAGLSETIRVRSILGRFLEHSRVLWFAGGGEPVAYLGSADLMQRNLDRRIEAMLRIRDPRQVALLERLIDVAMADDVSSWRLGPDGTWVRHAVAEDGSLLRDHQSELIEAARSRARSASPPAPPWAPEPGPEARPGTPVAVDTRL
ncbi:MAG: RNA degradosome polyphosphate kinase [Actinomycetales bacterium]